MRQLLLLLLLTGAAPAAVQKIHLSDRSDVLDGKEFGSAGAYERMVGKAYFAVDPALPSNRAVADLEYAPKNAGGLVEFSADIHVLKPRDPAKGNGTVLFEVSNRGGKGLLPRFHLNASASADPGTPADFGDNFLLEQGYTIVWLGWQMDLKQGLRIYPVRASGLPGKVRYTWIPVENRTTASLTALNAEPYPVTDPATATLTVRSRAEEEPVEMDRSKWSLAPDGITIRSDFQRGKIYEFIYTAQNPLVAGLGMAGIRDLISFLKYGGGPAQGFTLGDQRRFIKRAIGFGTSQSGRFLRAYLYDGFNADEQGRKVFDGLWPHVAGAGRGSFNHRFAHPTVAGNSVLQWYYPVDLFPFSDVEQTDAELDRTDHLLKKAEQQNVVPKIFYTNSSVEYYARVASLTATTLDGTKDVPLGRDSRMYFIAGTQHGPAAFPPPASAHENALNPGQYRWAMRALLVAMQDWLKDGKEPPPSQYPTVASGQLVRVESLKFPGGPKRLPGVRRMDLTKQPPVLKSEYTLLVPQVNGDRNETSGIRLAHVRVPLAAYTGWNRHKGGLGEVNTLAGLAGSFFPFDRATVLKRYDSKQTYLQQVSGAVDELIKERHVLSRDKQAIAEEAARMWDYVTK